MEKNELEKYRVQHKKRLNWMPWLFYSLKPSHFRWAKDWQQEVQQNFSFLETIIFGESCFVSEEANLFAEPGRTIKLGSGSWIGGNAFVHGPVELGNLSSINHGSKLDGGKAGIRIGNDVRIGPGCALYAFNHGFGLGMKIRNQGVESAGIVLGNDVWLGANVCVTDGVVLGDGCVVGMGAVVTKSFPEGSVLAGVPAKIIRKR